MKRLKTARAKGQTVGEPPRYSVEPLDPWLLCGPDTSVQELWKVREDRGHERTFHLVFLDRYGWYCEHGRNCAAVPEVRRAVREMSAARATTQQRTGRRRARNK